MVSAGLTGIEAAATAASTWRWPESGRPCPGRPACFSAAQADSPGRPILARWAAGPVDAGLDPAGRARDRPGVASKAPAGDPAASTAVEDLRQRADDGRAQCPWAQTRVLGVTTLECQLPVIDPSWN